MKYILVALFALIVCATASVTVLTDDNFEETLKEGNYFVKFYAPWCGHCKKLAPTWDELSDKADEAGAYKVAKIDCTESKSVCSENGIRGYPSLYYFSNGVRVEDRYAGPRTLDALNQYGEKQAAAAKKEDL